MMPLKSERPDTERRRSVRVEIPLEAIYSSNSPPVRARIQDLSENGLFIDTNHPLAVGAEVDLEFDLNDGDPKVKTRGRVMWSAPMMGCGIEFTTLTEQDRSRIRFFVAEVFFAAN